MKWRRFVYARKSEDRFLNKMEEAYGKDAVIAYGDWSRKTQMKHFMPTMGVGLRKLVAKRFQTVTVNEFRTSELCYRCYSLIRLVSVLNFKSKKPINTYLYLTPKTHKYNLEQLVFNAS